MANKGFNRRDFLKVLGAGTGLAASGCAREVPEKLIPYVVQPDEEMPGNALWYTGICNECSSGCGVLVRTKGGRALKVEGNPDHPINSGGLCSLGHSSLQALYDPDRLREPAVRKIGGSFTSTTWKKAIEAASTSLAAAKKDGGKTVIFTRPLGASESDLVSSFAKKHGSLEIVEYELLGDNALKAATESLYGRELETHFAFDHADVIVSVGADFLETWKSPVRQSKDFSSRRVPEKLRGKSLSQFFQIEPRLSLTGGNADKWIKNAPGSELFLLRALLYVAVSERSSRSPHANKIRSLLADFSLSEALKKAEVSEKDFGELKKSLIESDTSLVVAGGASVSEFSQEAAELAYLINEVLGNVGKTVHFYSTKKKSKSFVNGSAETISRLVAEINEGKVSAMMFVATNPVYSLPTSSGFQKALSKVPTIISATVSLDETSRHAQVVLPLSTSFESWSDQEPFPNMYSINQPAMQPVFESQGLGDIILSLAASESLDMAIGEYPSFYEYLRKKVAKRLKVPESKFENAWQHLLDRGGVWDDKVEFLSVGLKKVSKLSELREPEASDLSLLAYPVGNFGDGRGANRPWMQEIPETMTSAVWGSWIEMHPDVAKKNGVAHGDVVQVKTETGSIEAPAYVNPRMHSRLLAMPIGQGHEAFGRYASGVGSNVMAAMGFSSGAAVSMLTSSSVKVMPSVAKDELVTLQYKDSQLDRGFVRTVSKGKLGRLESGKEDTHSHGGGHHDPLALGPRDEPKQMYHQMEHPVLRWGMTIDLASCTGCSACVAACYAENNIAVVGKQICSQGREMSWIKISRYFDGDEDQPLTGFGPMLCQHCSNAPCEPVCPVYATYHAEDGLNTMVYNRCVGTRYCSNNCSYKVRRFNWFNYEWPEPSNWQLNPDVTVRGVGVMEKCSFCIQRIREGQNNAKNEGREIRDGEVQPACASSCPTDSITFGNLLDENSQVYHKSQSARGYKVLDFELNTQPAITYLAKVTHKEAESKGHGDHDSHSDNSH